MTKKTRNHGDDLRGASRLVIEATQAVTGVVEAMHRTIAGGPETLGRPLEGPARVVTGLVYGGIRGVTGMVGDGLDFALAQLGPMLGESVPGPERAAIVAVFNGVLGDYLADTGNPLATPMRLCRDGHPLAVEKQALAAAYPQAGGKLLVLVHGSCMNEQQWNRLGHDHGAALARDLGYTPVYLRYNSGLHISTNGRAFAELLERLVAQWPTPVEEVVIVGHSMGGLVARSACHVAEEEPAKHAWRTRLAKLIFLGSPHQGAPLERSGNWVEVFLGVNRYSAPLAQLGRLRSAGVTDLRFGNVLDEDWKGRDRFEFARDPRSVVKLPDGVQCYAIAGSLSPHDADRLRSDGMVPVDSALGRNKKPELTLAFPEDHRFIAFATGHLDLLNRAEVYAKLRSWLQP